MSDYEILSERLSRLETALHALDIKLGDRDILEAAGTDGIPLSSRENAVYNPHYLSLVRRGLIYEDHFSGFALLTDLGRLALALD